MTRTEVRAGPPWTRTQPPRSTLAWLAGGAAAGLVGLLAGLYLGGAAYATAPDGLPDAGPLVGWGLPIASFLTVGFGVLTLGLLVAAAFLMPSGDRDVVSRAGRRDLVAASVSAACWSVSALCALAFSHAAILGEPISRALQADIFFTFAFEIGVNVAYAFVAVVALIVCGCAAVSMRTGSAAMLTGLTAIGVVAVPVAGHGSSLGDHSLAVAAGALHGLAAALWVGGLLAMTRHALRRDPGLETAMPRFSTLATTCVVVLVVSGIANAYTRLEQLSDLFSSAYGVLVLLKVALLAIILVVAARSRAAATRSPQSTGRKVQWLLTEGMLLAVTIGVAVSLSLTAYPRADVPLATPGEQLLGFPFPGPPTGASLFFGWYPDVTFLLLAAVLGAGYGWGVWRLRRRAIAWPWGRVVSWYAGVLILTWASSAGIAAYARVSVQWHMAQHMVFAMVVPILLVMGTPAMLALRAFRPARGRDRGPREWVLWGLQSPVSKVITHPVYVLAIGTFGLFGLYFTPLFAVAMGSHLGHIAMGVHFLLSGFLFYWVVLGLDPGPRQIPAWARLMLLLIYISLHAFFAVAIMMATEPLAAEWFSLVQPPWITDPVKDSVDGGGVAWAFGELPTLVVMIAVSIQWARSDDREAKRRDRQADRDGGAELAAYNARLAAMARRAEDHQHRG